METCDLFASQNKLRNIPGVLCFGQICDTDRCSRLQKNESQWTWWDMKMECVLTLRKKNYKQVYNFIKRAKREGLFTGEKYRERQAFSSPPAPPHEQTGESTQPKLSCFWRICTMKRGVGIRHWALVGVCRHIRIPNYTPLSMSTYKQTLSCHQTWQAVTTLASPAKLPPSAASICSKGEGKHNQNQNILIKKIKTGRWFENSSLPLLIFIT